MGNEIVVGLDSSAAGRAALHWAAQQARLAGAVLRAVHVLDWPTGVGAAGVPLMGEWVYPQEESVESTVRDTITGLFDEVDPAPDWSLEFGRGKAGTILVHAAKQATLLVVGTGEHVGLGRILVGSTSHYCFSHAACPVVAVPASAPSSTSPLVSAEVATSDEEQS